MFEQLHKKSARNIYPRRSYLRNDIAHGLSDIDIMYVFDEDKNFHFHVSQVRKYSLLYPLVVDTEFMSKDVFEMWINGDDVRGMEFKANCLKKKLNIRSNDVFFFSSVKEIFNLYFYLLDSTHEKNATLKKYLIEKHIIEINRVIIFYKHRKDSHLVAKRKDMMALRPREELSIDSMFHGINDLAEKFLLFLKKRFGIDINEDNFPTLGHTQIYSRKAIFSDKWVQLGEEQAPLSKSMFIALKACSFEEHEILQCIIKRHNHADLEMFYLQRVYSDITWGISHDAPKRLFYYILLELFKYKDTKKEFEEKTGICLESLNSSSPMGQRLEMRLIDFFLQHYLASPLCTSCQSHSDSL